MGDSFLIIKRSDGKYQGPGPLIDLPNQGRCSSGKQLGSEEGDRKGKVGWSTKGGRNDVESNDESIDPG